MRGRTFSLCMALLFTVAAVVVVFLAGFAAPTPRESVISPTPMPAMATVRAARTPIAVCRDGSLSNAVGRSVCSWHGGVQEWRR